jgi:hypothetical protein
MLQPERRHASSIRHTFPLSEGIGESGFVRRTTTGIKCKRGGRFTRFFIPVLVTRFSQLIFPNLCQSNSTCTAEPKLKSLTSQVEGEAVLDADKGIHDQDLGRQLEEGHIRAVDEDPRPPFVHRQKQDVRPQAEGCGQRHPDSGHPLGALYGTSTQFRGHPCTAMMDNRAASKYSDGPSMQITDEIH